MQNKVDLTFISTQCILELVHCVKHLNQSENISILSMVPSIFLQLYYPVQTDNDFS